MKPKSELSYTLNGIFYIQYNVRTLVCRRTYCINDTLLIFIIPTIIRKIKHYIRRFYTRLE